MAERAGRDAAKGVICPAIVGDRRGILKVREVGKPPDLVIGIVSLEDQIGGRVRFLRAVDLGELAGSIVTEINPLLTDGIAAPRLLPDGRAWCGRACRTASS